MLHLLGNLGLASVMVVVTVVIHFLGLIALIGLLERHGRRVDHWHRVARQSILLVVAVLGIVFLHTLEIWSYAVLYIVLGVFKGLEPSLYFSTVSFTSLGYGDVVLGPDWRILGAIEAANGLILFGWSTAFLLSMMGKLRALEHEWLEK
jgi:Na+/melibiose symporter-like transporter